MQSHSIEQWARLFSWSGGAHAREAHVLLSSNDTRVSTDELVLRNIAQREYAGALTDARPQRDIGAELQAGAKFAVDRTVGQPPQRLEGAKRSRSQVRVGTSNVRSEPENPEHCGDDDASRDEAGTRAFGSENFENSRHASPFVLLLTAVREPQHWGALSKRAQPECPKRAVREGSQFSQVMSAGNEG